MKLLMIFLFIAALFSSVHSQDRDFADAVSRSTLTQTGLPGGSFRIRDQNVPSEYQKLFVEQIKMDPAFRQGKSEFIVLTSVNSKKTELAQLRDQVESALRNEGWDYKVNPPENNVAFFIATKKLPARRIVFGYWFPLTDGLMLAMTEILTNQNSANNNISTDPERIEANDNSSTSNQNPENALMFNVSASENYVNLMGNRLPDLPTFSALPKKPGTVRGYVKDSAGKPLAGAYLGVRSTLNGGAYSGASAVTDAKGFYEIKLPMGAIHFYAASYTVDYGSLRASLSLHPADGRLDGFASANGEVENFVLLSYGIADRDRASNTPNGAPNYYGGAIQVGYSLAEAGDSYAPAEYIKENSEIEITLTPEGSLLDGTSGKSFVIRKNVGNGMFFNIFNIPIGKYTITARLVKGNRALSMTQSPRNKNNSGITPKAANGRASLIFEPAKPAPEMVLPAYGNWNPVELRVKLSD